MLDDHTPLFHLGSIQDVVDKLQQPHARHLDGGNGLNGLRNSMAAAAAAAAELYCKRLQMGILWLLLGLSAYQRNEVSSQTVSVLNGSYILNIIKLLQ